LPIKASFVHKLDETFVLH